jgi:lysyl-tRNA synthetase class 2
LSLLIIKSRYLFLYLCSLSSKEKKVLPSFSFILGSGEIFYTKTKELSIDASNVSLLSKNIRPLPNMKEKDGKTFFSFDDKEHRYRKRYLDLIINNDNKLIFIKRSKIINELRSFLNLNDFIEVENQTQSV